MSEIIDSVNRIGAYFSKAKKAFEERENRERAIEMAHLETDTRAVKNELKRLEAMTRPIPIVDGDDLSDLPPELLSELTVAKTDALEDQIATVINATGGEADIDTILIYLFRRFKVIQTRRYIQNKLWRMVQKGLLFSVEGRKGHYSTRPETTVEFVDSSNSPMGGDDAPPEDEYDDEIPF